MSARKQYDGEADNRRLREALEEMVAAMESYEHDASEPAPQRHLSMMDRARRALSGATEGEASDER